MLSVGTVIIICDRGKDLHDALGEPYKILSVISITWDSTPSRWSKDPFVRVVINLVMLQRRQPKLFIASADFVL